MGLTAVGGARTERAGPTLALGLILAACGGSDGSSAAASSTPEAGMSAGQAAVAELAFAPQNPHLLEGAATPSSWGLGRDATTTEIGAVDIDIMPDGRGLPAGSGTAAEGEVLYRAQCAACHGPTGTEGTPLASPLIAEDAEAGFRARVVGPFWPYASTVFDYVRRAMPWDRPGTLTDDQVYSIVAYVLAGNGIIQRDMVLDAEALSAVTMPAVDRFVPDDRQGGAQVR